MKHHFLLALIISTFTATFAHAETLQISDAEVETETGASLDDYFTPFNGSISLSERVEISSLRVGADTMLAIGALKASNKLLDISEKNRVLAGKYVAVSKNKPYTFKYRLRYHAAGFGSQIALVAGVILIFDSITGTVIAYHGSKPLYAGNLIALTLYMTKTVSTPTAPPAQMNSEERRDFEELNRRIEQSLSRIDDDK